MKTINRGSNNPQAKLTEDQVREIRKLKLSPKQLAERFNVAPSTIRQVLYRYSWAHVD